MNKRLGTLLAGLCLVAAAEVAMGAPPPSPKRPPAPCPSWKRCPPPPSPCSTGPCRQEKSSTSGWSTNGR